MILNSSVFEYSVDMVRLKCCIKKYDFKKYFDVFMGEPNIKYKEMTLISAYRHNFYFKDTIEQFNCSQFDKVYLNECDFVPVDKVDTCSFWVGAFHNSSSFALDYVDVVIQYNPNKCSNSYLLDYVLKHIFLFNDSCTVQSLDIAIDIPCNINDVQLVRDYNCSFRTFELGGDNKTFYMRKRGSHGALKVYNKKRESNLKRELTRYEITLHTKIPLKFISDYSVDIELFPSLRITSVEGVQIGFDIVKVTGTDKILLLACMEHPEYLKELSRDKRKKIESLLNSLSSKIDFQAIIINNTIKNYFDNLLKK